MTTPATIPLSEAILLGALARPGKFIPVWSKESSCVCGAAMEGIGEQDRVKFYRNLTQMIADRWPWAIKAVPYPSDMQNREWYKERLERAKDHKGIGFQMSELMDSGWTRERVGGWVRQLEEELGLWDHDQRDTHTVRQEVP